MCKYNGHNIYYISILVFLKLYFFFCLIDVDVKKLKSKFKQTSVLFYFEFLHNYIMTLKYTYTY